MRCQASSGARAQTLDQETLEDDDINVCADVKAEGFANTVGNI